MLLAKNPHVVRRISVELARAGVTSATEPGDVTFDDIQEMAYINNVLKEVLRVLPPVGAGFPQSSEHHRDRGQ